MIYAVKGNKQLQIDEAEQSTYLKLGYDIAEADGNELKVLETSPSSTVTYAQFKALQDENEDLKERLEAVDASSELKTQFEKLQSELDKFKDENKELKAEIKALKAEAKK